MFAGLPGTGIGGVFYLLLALWMGVVETGRALRGKSSRERWRFIGKCWAIFGAVFAAMYLQAVILNWLLPAQQAELLRSTATANEVVHSDALIVKSWELFTTASSASVLVLAAVIVLLHVARGVLALREAAARA